MEIKINNQTFNVIVANTFWRRFIGLMGQKEITKGIFFPKTNSIHTFFMRQNIDIIMLNKDMEIVYLQENVGKRKIIYKKEAYHTIELPSHSIHHIHLKDQVIAS